MSSGVMSTVAAVAEAELAGVAATELAEAVAETVSPAPATLSTLPSKRRYSPIATV